MPLDEKRRLLLDKVLMAFGSQMKVCELNPLSNDWKLFREETWQWTIQNVGALIEQVFETPPEKQNAPEVTTSPPAVAAEPTPEPELENGKFTLTKTITVKEVKVLRSGTGRQGNWSLFGIKGQDNIVYATFAGSRYIPGETYTIEYEEVPSKNGQYVDYRIVEPR